MSEHELLSPYQTKAIEYALAVAYLLVFIPFWRRLSVPARAGAGWLFRVQPDRLGPNLRSLFSRGKARRFLAEAAESLYLAFHPEAVSLAQDGGLLVHGIARELDPEHRDDLFRSVLMTRRSKGGPP
jgi:hypothetical protein